MLEMDVNYGYESLSEELARAGVVPSLAELHGGLTGMMCIAGVAAADRWLDQQLEEWSQSGQTRIGEALHAVELDTWRMLNETDMSFEPLLPGDEQPLDAQVRGLASWCHGFLSGLGLGGLTLDGSTSDEGTVAEIAKDFAEISRAALGPEDEQEPEQTGFALAQLKEYVRVSVQILFEQLGERSDDAGRNTFH
ncbi:MAG TPA: UPF0149 family protein [Gammaproteobacteria bacterium]